MMLLHLIVSLASVVCLADFTVRDWQDHYRDAFSNVRWTQKKPSYAHWLKRSTDPCWVSEPFVETGATKVANWDTRLLLCRTRLVDYNCDGSTPVASETVECWCVMKRAANNRGILCYKPDGSDRWFSQSPDYKVDKLLEYGMHALHPKDMKSLAAWNPVKLIGLTPAEVRDTELACCLTPGAWDPESHVVPDPTLEAPGAWDPARPEPTPEPVDLSEPASSPEVDEAPESSAEVDLEAQRRWRHQKQTRE